MCLETRKSTPQVCQKSKLVYKQLCFIPRVGTFSMFRAYQYKYGIQPLVKMESDPDWDFTNTIWHNVHRAYHSWHRSNEDTNALFLIPKGALYFEGAQGSYYGYASNTIVYLGRRYRLMTYLRLLYYKLKFR